MLVHLFGNLEFKLSSAQKAQGLGPGNERAKGAPFIALFFVCIVPTLTNGFVPTWYLHASRSLLGSWIYFGKKLTFHKTGGSDTGTRNPYIDAVRTVIPLINNDRIIPI
jgi:hypothetical protein